MTCDECKQILLDPDNCFTTKSWMPGVSVVNLAKSHAQTCPACAARMSGIAGMNSALDQLRSFDARMETPPAVEANLLAAFRRGETARTPAIAKIFFPRFAWAAAVALLLAATGIVPYTTLAPRSPNTAETQTTQRQQFAQAPLSSGPAVASGAMIDSTRPGTDRNVATSPKRHVPHLGGKTQSEPRHHEPKPQPMPQPSPSQAGDQLSLNGGSNVVRVTLPLESLVAMGIPVYPDGPDRRVTADVTMDPFGAVLAVHLVEVKSGVN